MENFEAWVSRESEKLGINFASLDLESRNRLLEELMSGLENGFRSRMDSPDLRFAMRKGIGRKYTAFSHYDQSDGCSYPMSGDSTCPLNNTAADTCFYANPCTPTDTQCPPGSTGNAGPDCIDFCQDSSSCPPFNENDQVDCAENDGKTCDNGCINTTASECKDDANCFDNKCSNVNVQSYCTDENKCYDFRCKNEGQSCNDNSSTGPCFDQKCHNGTCNDTNKCGTPLDQACGDKQCLNRLGCNDGDTQIESTCLDSSCYNSAARGSSVPEACTDQRCFDAICINTYGTCVDGKDGTACSDDVCQNSATRGEYCTNESSSCTDISCHHRPLCYDGGSGTTNTCSDSDCPDVPNFSCTDAGTQCIDVDNCEDAPCSNSSQGNFRSWQCSDSGSCTDNSCTNERMCNDDASSQSCNDNQCVNQMMCTDFGNCSDASCDNEMCNDRSPSCADTNCNNETCENGRGPYSSAGCGANDNNTQDGFCTDIQTSTGCTDRNAVDHTVNNCRYQMCYDTPSGCTYSEHGCIDSGPCSDTSAGIICSDETITTCVNDPTVCRP